MESSSFNVGRSKRVGTRAVCQWSERATNVCDKRIKVTMKAKGAMIVMIALMGEELHKAGLPKPLYRSLLSGCSCNRACSFGYGAC